MTAALNQHVRHLACARDQIAIGDAAAVELLDREPAGVVEAVEQAGKQIGVGGRVHAKIPRGAKGRKTSAGLAKTPFRKQRRQFA
ncbi:hypothetical protein ABIF31_002228 [Bradyrhizobium elkanii]